MHWRSWTPRRQHCRCNLPVKYYGITYKIEASKSFWIIHTSEIAILKPSVRINCNVKMNLVRSATLTCKTSHVNIPITLKTLVRNYAFKSDLKIKWVHPGKIACTEPEKSGDLKPMPTIEKSQIQVDFQKSKELETANDLVKKLFTLEFAPRSRSTQLYIRETVDMVRRHPMDNGSTEALIAQWTGSIRAMQEVMTKFPRNKRLKVKLKELIDKRKKHLKYMRRWDYKKFEWLLETLNIVYKPPPNEFHWVTRRGSLRKLTEKYCDDLKTERLASYRLQLESEQPAFLEEKIRTLEFIRQEQADCGVEITITQEEIDSVKKQLQDLHEEQTKQPKLDL